MLRSLQSAIGLDALTVSDSEADWRRSPSEVRRLRLLASGRVAMSLIVAIACAQLVAYGFGTLSFLNFGLSALLACLCAAALQAAKSEEKFDPQISLLFTLFSGVIWAKIIMTGGLSSPSLPLLFGVPVAAAMLLRVRSTLMIVGLSVIALIGIFLLPASLYKGIFAPLVADQYSIALFANALATVLMVSFCTFVISQQADATRRHMRELIEHEANLAAHDQLSGLGNRNRLQQFFRDVRPDKDRYDFLLIDLDGFKSINDTHGHNAGDYVIKAAAARLKEVTEEDDMLIRLGGDEFLIVAPSGDTTLEKMNEYGSRLIEIISRPYPANGQVLRIGASIGHARFPIHGKSPSQSLSLADKALYVAKGAGKGICVTFGVAPRIRKTRKTVLRKKSA